MISIIIPTLNEEKYLPLLLASIKNQAFKEYEIILADAGSKDRTVEIAKQYGCRIIPGGSPSKGRNEGAKVAKGELLFFIDADAVLPPKFFEKSLRVSTIIPYAAHAFSIFSSLEYREAPELFNACTR